MATIQKKILIFVIITCTILTSPNHPAFAISNNPLMYEGITSQIPIETLSLPPDYKNKPYIYVNIGGKNTKLYFNTELWVDKNIGVYGHYSYVHGNDFKNYTENPNPSITTPYYSRNGVEGEYRYHGYTLDGIRHTNKSFPVDEASTRKAEQKTWQYRYWTNSVLKQKKDGKMSRYNEDAISPRTETQQWINEGLPFEIKNGSNPSSRNAYDYANVLTPSTLYSFGEAKMWHKNNTGYWYQTFTLKKRTGRKQTPVILDINILNKSKNIINVGESKMKINVDVTITLQDEAYYNNVIEKEIYYTRRDIEYYNLELNGTTYTFEGNGTTNTYQGTVSLEVPRNIMTTNGDYEVNGIASVSYVSETSNNAYDDDHDTVDQPIKFRLTDDLLCKFGLASVVNHTEDRPIKAEMFKYKDLSMGNINKYKIELTGKDGTQVTKEYSTSSMDSSTINNLLLDMAKGKDNYHITVKQTVYDGTRSAESENKVYIVKVYVPKKVVEIDVDLPRKVFDIEPYGASIGEMKPEDIDLLEVTIDGSPISVSVNDFFNGGFTFGEIQSDNNTEVHFIEVKATSSDDVESFEQKWVTVYNTKPKAQLALQGTQKENRKFEAINTSDNANDPYLLQYYPTTYTYQVTALNGSDKNKFHYEKIGENHIFQGSQEGTYQISCTATNRSGRSSTYILPLVVMKDHKPAMNFDIWNNYLTRKETLSMEYGVESVDGDTIVNKKIKILKDRDKDGSYETVIIEAALVDDFTYTPSELGNYRAIITADEIFGEETVNKWLDGTEKRSNEIVRDFFVQNLRPLTEVHLDVPFNFPEVDLIIALDKGLSDSKKADIKSKRIDYNNYLRSQGINPIVEIWDMKCYEYSTPASSSKSTGGSYPPSSIAYTSGDYSGTLSRSNVVNNWYWHDYGYYTTEEECSTSTERYKYYPCDDYTWEELCEMYGGWDCGFFEFRYRTITSCSNVQVWHSDNRKVNNYTGYYSGTIYKYVRQTPPTQSFRTNADKYIIYVSDNGINITAPSEHKNRLSPVKEFSNLISEHDFNITLIGNDTIKEQSDHDQYLSNADIPTSITNALDIIIGEHPFSADYLIEVGQGINIETVELETEGDGLKENVFQYIHNPHYYDNSLGMLSYAKAVFDEGGEWTTYKPTVIEKPGQLVIHHWVKDNIPGYEGDEMYSNIAIVPINIHRKPIAKFNLDLDFEPTTQLYKTKWEDESYDLDHQFSDPNKGIVDRKIVYWDHSRPTEKFYKIPDNLKAGRTYTAEYIVKDMEGVWSDVYRQTFTLNNIPPIQLKANLKTEDDKFVIGNIPSSENLLAFDIWTRFPYGIRLEVALYNTSNTLVAPVKSITFSEGVTGDKTDNDINWYDISFQVPATTPDGQYKLVVKAIGVDGQVEAIPFTVEVYTPVWEDYRTNSLQTIVDPLNIGESLLLSPDTSFTEKNSLEIETSKYTEKVKVILDNNITFYIFNDGTASRELNGSGKSMPLNYITSSQRYQINNLAINQDEIKKVWSFDLSLVSNYPFKGEQVIDIEFYGYDTAGRWDTSTNKHGLNPQSLTVKLLDLKLENLRVINILDPDFKYLFETEAGEETTMQKEGIPVKDFAIYMNSENDMIAIGYKVQLEIDSIGLYGEDDQIEIDVHYYALGEDNKLYLSDVYVTDYKGTYIKLEDSGYISRAKKIILDKDNRIPYEKNPADPSKNTWMFNHYLPYNTKFVKYGNSLDLFDSNAYKDKVLVVFEVVAKKAIGASTYDYTDKEMGWGTDNGSSYGKSKNTNNDLIGKAINHGEIFWYDLKHNALDDLQISREW